MQTYNENLLRDTLEFIRKYQEVEGRSPSYRAICHGVNGFTSLAKVHRYINVLDERGLIEKTQNIGIEIPTTHEAGRCEAAQLVGAVACGTPILAYENVEGTYMLPTELYGGGEKFLLRAKGNSMVEKNIHNGDLIVVRKQNNADPGQVVIHNFLVSAPQSATISPKSAPPNPLPPPPLLFPVLRQGLQIKDRFYCVVVYH